MVQFWWVGVIILAALFLVAGWICRVANVGPKPIEAELQNAVAGELWRATQTQKVQIPSSWPAGIIV